MQGNVTIPAAIEVDGEPVMVGTVELKLDVAAIRVDEDGEMYAVLDAKVED
jgi:hypothetical protein